MHGRGAVCGRGLCVAGGHAWWGACVAEGHALQGVCMVGGMHGRGHLNLHYYNSVYQLITII